MAKKDEEDTMEDYDNDEAEDKPKKKASKRKKKSKTWMWVVAFVVILAILLLIRWKYTPTEATKNETPVEEQAPPEQVENQYVTEPSKTTTTKPASEQVEEQKELGDQVVPKEDLPNVQENVDTTAEPTLFSNLKCEYDETSKLLYISLHVYNVFNQDMLIAPHGVQKGYNTYFKIRGTVDTDPGCGTEILAPGEYTDCKRIGFENARYSNTPGINRISVQTPGGSSGGTEALLIECPKVPEDALVLQWIRP